MTQTIYIDVLILVNLLVNYFLLLTVRGFLHVPVKRGRVFLGALAGYLSTLPPGLPPFEEVKKGIVYGTVAASFTCESFSADALLSMTKETFRRRLEEYAEMCRLPDIRLFSASDC